MDDSVPTSATADNCTLSDLERLKLQNTVRLLYVEIVQWEGYGHTGIHVCVVNVVGGIAMSQK